MIEEPYRWVEAVANRREYIETQLASGSPIVALSFRDGILFLTSGRTRQKVFEIYDRIAMGAIGHPGDIERLRLAAIELASTEGFTRSAADVSLRRLAYYSLSPVLKTAFEQVYGAPYLVRMLFAEIGSRPDEDLFLAVQYDGAIETSGGPISHARQSFGVLSGTPGATEMMQTWLEKHHEGSAFLTRAVQIAMDAWTVGKLALGEAGGQEVPDAAAIAKARKEQLGDNGIEAAVLERDAQTAIRYRSLGEQEIERAVGG